MPVSNGTKITRPLVPGVYAPIPTFFQPGSEDLDIPTFQKHIVRIANANVGILICGSMGEAHHLSPTERIELIRAARAALDAAHFLTVPLVVGTGAGSTRETIKLTKEAADAGADYSIVIPSGYFAGAFDRKTIKDFFHDVAEASPIPVMVYNYPGAAGGIDMDSDLIEEMAMEFPNLCGVKLTCGNVGKLTRIAATVGQPSFASKYPRKNKDAPFLVLGGFVDFLLPSTFAGAHGAITGLANLYPHTLRALWTSSIASLPSNASTNSQSTLAQSLTKGMHLQDLAAHGDRTIAVTGIAGTKWLMARRYGYGGVTRLPLRPLDDTVGETLKVHPHVVAIEEMEKSLEKENAKSGVAPIAAAGKATNGVGAVSNGISNGVPVSSDDSVASPSSATDSPTSTQTHTQSASSSSTAASAAAATAATAAVSKRPDITAHKRSGSLTSSLRSLIGSLRGKKTATAT